jgi:hypothetical protein
MHKVYSFPEQPHPPKHHNWDKILDGNIWFLTQGEDFIGEINDMMISARNAALHRKLKVTVQRAPDGFYIQAWDKK